MANEHFSLHDFLRNARILVWPLADSELQSMSIELTATNGGNPHKFCWEWKRKGARPRVDEDEEEYWQIRIPINGLEGLRGCIRLMHDVKRDGELLQADSLLDAFGNRFVLETLRVLSMENADVWRVSWSAAS